VSAMGGTLSRTERQVAKREDALGLALAASAT
jgi:hypothetical protein